MPPALDAEGMEKAGVGVEAGAGNVIPPVDEAAGVLG